MKINKPISAIIILLVILILYFLFIMPEYRKISDLQNNLAQKQIEYDGKSVYYSKIAELIKNIESKPDSLEKINSALSSDYYLSSLVYFFQKKGAENGLKVNSIALSQISAPATDNNIKDITFSIRLSGTYESLKKFLSSLDKSARLFEVNSISFSGTGNSPQQIYDFNMEVQTHAY